MDPTGVNSLELLLCCVLSWGKLLARQRGLCANNWYCTLNNSSRETQVHIRLLQPLKSVILCLACKTTFQRYSGSLVMGIYQKTTLAAPSLDSLLGWDFTIHCLLGSLISKNFQDSSAPYSHSHPQNTWRNLNILRNFHPTKVPANLFSNSPLQLLQSSYYQSYYQLLAPLYDVG